MIEKPRVKKQQNKNRPTFQIKNENKIKDEQLKVMRKNHHLVWHKLNEPKLKGEGLLCM